MRNIKVLRSIVLILFVVVSAKICFGNPEEGSEQIEKHGHDEETGKFEANKFIFDHIGDSYEWHILTTPGGKHVSIYLPVILYSKNSGLHAFSSRKFHHGHESYQNFHWVKEGPGKGKIVEIDADNHQTEPLDFSITKNIAAMLFSIALLLYVFLTVAKRYKRKPNKAPKGIQSFVEPIILFIRDEVAKPSIGHRYEKFMPYLLTVFFFIWFNNMLGLIPIPPGGANLTGNIAVTVVLALFTFIITTINGNHNYWKHILNTPGVPWWMKFPIPLMPLVEVFGMFTKPFVLMIRLFANISAGHIISLGFLSLIFIFGEINVYIGHGVSVFTVVFLIFMTFLELLVAFIQAYVFTFLSALYFGMAVEEHH